MSGFLLEFTLAEAGIQLFARDQYDTGFPQSS